MRRVVQCFDLRVSDLRVINVINSSGRKSGHNRFGFARLTWHAQICYAVKKLIKLIKYINFDVVTFLFVSFATTIL